MKKAIVTGANGFVGTEICKELSRQGTEVIAVVRNENENVGQIKDLPKLRIVYCDLSEFKNLANVISDRDADVMYHMAWAGCSGAVRGDSDIQTDNVRFTCDTVRACKEMGCGRFVFAASLMEYETEALMQSELTPGINSLYCTAKIAADYMARAIAGSLGIDYIRAVISNIYGVGEKSPRLVNTSIRKLLSGEHCAFSPGDQMYDFIYVTDAARMFAALGDKGRSNKTYYIGDTPKPLKEYLTELRDTVMPNAELGLGKLPFEGVSLTYDEFDKNAVYEDTGIKAEVTFAEGVRKTAEWIKEGN